MNRFFLEVHSCIRLNNPTRIKGNLWKQKSSEAPYFFCWLFFNLRLKIPQLYTIWDLGHSIQGELCNHCSHRKLEMPSFWGRFNSSQRCRCTQCDFVGQISEKAKKTTLLETGPQNNESVKIWGFPKMVGFPNNHWVFLQKMTILEWRLGVPPF